MSESSARPTQPLRAAVVGSGAIAREHLSFLAGTSPIRPSRPVDGRIRLVGVCDLSPVTASYGADEYGADAAYTDLATMLDEARPDVVHVLTPPATHSPIASACLLAGANVICEKPITATAGELVDLLEVAQSAGRHLMESQNYRFNRPVLSLVDAIDDGRLGAVREVEIRIVLPVTDPENRFADPHLPSPIHEMPAGVIHDVITHMAYLLLLLGRPVSFDRIAAAWSNHGDNPLFRFDDLDAVLIGHTADGPLHARLRFDAEASPDTFSIRVRGTEGWAETDLYQPYVRVVRPRTGGQQLSPIINHVAGGWRLLEAGTRNVGRKIMQQTPYEGLHRMLDLTYDAIADGRPLPISNDDMLETSKLVDRLLDDKVRL
ncbi:MAG: Gfo/Idh/MocA family oxidoreductase [Actinomycetota bacterium]